MNGTIPLLMSSSSRWSNWDRRESGHRKQHPATYSSQATYVNTNSMLYPEWEVDGTHDALKCDCMGTQHVIQVPADISNGMRIASPIATCQDSGMQEPDMEQSPLLTHLLTQSLPGISESVNGSKKRKANMKQIALSKDRLDLSTPVQLVWQIHYQQSWQVIEIMPSHLIQ